MASICEYTMNYVDAHVHTIERGSEFANSELAALNDKTLVQKGSNFTLPSPQGLNPENLI